MRAPELQREQRYKFIDGEVRFIQLKIENKIIPWRGTKASKRHTSSTNSHVNSVNKQFMRYHLSKIRVWTFEFKSGHFKLKK